MENTLKKFLEFNGKNIYFVSHEDVWWVAIKPICEALNVDYESQRENLKKDKILSQLPSTQGVVAKDGRLRKMVCLPEHYVYGWLFKIQSDSPELEEYQWKCYDILFNYFRGSIDEKNKVLKEKTLEEREIEKALDKVAATPEFKALQELKDRHAITKKALKKVERDEFALQLSLWGLDEDVINKLK